MKIIIKIFFASLLFFTINIFAQTDNQYYFKGISEFAYNNYLLAIQDFTTAINQAPEDYSNYLARANAYYANNQYKEAITDYKKAQSLKSDISNFLIAKAYAKTNNIDSSIYFLQKNLESSSKILKSEMLTEDAFDVFKNTEKWNNFLNQDNFSANDLLFNDANYKIETGKYLEALEIANIMISKNKKKHKAYVLKAQIFELTNNYKSAIDCYEKATKISVNNIDYQTKLANSYLMAENYKKAVESYNFLIEKNPKELNYYLQRAKANYGAKNYSTALDDIKLYNTYFYNDKESMFLYSEILYQNQEYLEAIKILNSLIEKNNTVSKYYVARANAFYKANSYKLAINDFSTALDLNPTETEVYINRGLAKKEIDDLEGACNDWNTAVEKGNYKANNYIIENCRVIKK